MAQRTQIKKSKEVLAALREQEEEERQAARTAARERVLEASGARARAHTVNVDAQHRSLNAGNSASANDWARRLG